MTQSKANTESIELSRMQDMGIGDLANWLVRMIELSDKLKSKRVFKKHRINLDCRINKGLGILKDRSLWKDYKWRRMLNVTRNWK